MVNTWRNRVQPCAIYVILSYHFYILPYSLFLDFGMVFWYVKWLSRCSLQNDLQQLTMFELLEVFFYLKSSEFLEHNHWRWRVHWMTMFEWYMGRFIVKKVYIKHTCHSVEIDLCAQYKHRSVLKYQHSWVCPYKKEMAMFASISTMNPLGLQYMIWKYGCLAIANFMKHGSI
jgi:hypothetical protein